MLESVYLEVRLEGGGDMVREDMEALRQEQRVPLYLSYGGSPLYLGNRSGPSVANHPVTLLNMSPLRSLW